MSAISTILARLRAAIWAIDVRDDIANAIEQCYNDVNNPTLKTEALEAALQTKIDEGEMAALTIGDHTITAAKLAQGVIDNTLATSGAAADAKKVGDELSALKADLGATMNNDMFVELPFEVIAGGFIRHDTGGLQSSQTRDHTNYVDVSKFKKIQYSIIKLTTTSTSNKLGMAWYDANKKYISGESAIIAQPEEEYADVIREVPQGAVYARFSVRQSDNPFHVDGLNELASSIDGLETAIATTNAALTTTTNDIKDMVAGGDIQTYVDFEKGYIDTSGNTIDISSVVSSVQYCHIVIPCTSGDVFNFNTRGGNENRRRWAFIDGNGNIISKSSGMREGADQTPFIYNPQELITAPSNSVYLVANHNKITDGFTPKIYKCHSDTRANYVASKWGEYPYFPWDDWRRKVIATYNSYIAIKDGNTIKLSDDCGRTWGTGIDASGVTESIRNSHIYTDGTLTFFTETKAYYVENGIIRESAVYEADGSTAFVFDVDDNFNASRDHAERKTAKGVDMYVFNNYHKYGDGRPIVWYSIDRGRTYKVACEFNTGSFPTIKHFHDVLYWETYDKFIVTTGDANASACYVYEMEYDSVNDSWTVTYIAGSERKYKWAGMALWNNELYYTLDNTPGGVWKCKYADIADLTKHVCVLPYTEDDCNNVVFGKNGDMIVTQSTARSTGGLTVDSPYTAEEACRKIYYSSNRLNFQELFLPNQFTNISSLLRHPKPITNDGHVYFGTSSGTDGLPSVPVDDYARLFLNGLAFGAHI